jgi:hypothetical protein
MDLLMAAEAPPPGRLCSACGQDGVYKCHSCLAEPLFCTNCCRTQHMLLPFHRISQWTGCFFQETCLMKLGVEVFLGHQGQPCPNCPDSLNPDVFDWYDSDDEITNSDLPDGTAIPLIMDHKAMTVVDKSGVHSVMIRYCLCSSALSQDTQLFQMGMFPASFNRPKTAFTFAVLDDFLLDNLECGTSAMNYYSKLRRMTSSVFPHLVPVSNILCIIRPRF